MGSKKPAGMARLGQVPTHSRGFVEREEASQHLDGIPAERSTSHTAYKRRGTGLHRCCTTTDSDPMQSGRRPPAQATSSRAAPAALCASGIPVSVWEQPSSPSRPVSCSARTDWGAISASSSGWRQKVRRGIAVALSCEDPRANPRELSAPAPSGPQEMGGCSRQPVLLS